MFLLSVVFNEEGLSLVLTLGAIILFIPYFMPKISKKQRER